MVEQWLQAHIFFKFNQLNNISNVLMEVVKPCADTLKSKDIRKTYHYFIEDRTDKKDGVELLLRIEVKEDIEKIEKIIDERIKEYEHLTNGFKIDYDFKLEKHICDFGQDGWELTKQLFEIGSEIAIGYQSKSFSKGELFKYEHLIHYLLNQNLKSIIDEANLHADRLIERVIKYLENKEFSEVEKISREILEHYLKAWKNNQELKSKQK